ncbi:hypothetical protein WJX73_006914 [Symbiochloris irregularis]|uniref:RRM domain-containing protein n=1 Tax=Symbiochloris irregularis TaxID=706552 RepID=A0AAW1NW93_9CHLO
MPRRSRSRSRDRHRRRSRSRSRDRHRSSRHRSRSRDRDRRSRSPSSRSKRSAFSDPDQQSAQYAQLAAMQQQQLQKQLLAQQLLMQQQAMTGNMGMVAGRKQREVYVGNLTIGVVTDLMLKELFSGALAHYVPDPVGNPPVVNAQLDPSGRFGFVEMRTEELAAAAMSLDKVELCGRNINVGRPKGYVEPPGGVAASNLGAAQMFAASIATAATRVLLLQNMMKAHRMWDEEERRDLLEDVQEESGKYGKVMGISVPKPPAGTSSEEPNRVYILFENPAQAKKAKEVFDGRSFDGNVIKAKFVDFGAGVTNMPPPPGLTQVGPLPPGISGVAALNPALATMMQGNPLLAGMVNHGPVDAADVPFQEGWLKLRGIPFTVTKPDIVRFFEGCGTFTEDKIKLVLGMDGRPTGEAYCEISGPGAKLRLALSRDRQVMPNSSRYAVAPSKTMWLPAVIIA